jgi:hypothetical protein
VELDLGVIERNVGAALDIGRVTARVVDRLPVDGDAHDVELVGALGLELPGDPRDVHAFEVVQGQRLVVHGLHANERRFALNESAVHDVVRLDVASPLVLGSSARQRRILHDGVLGAARPSRRQAHVVAVNGRGATVEALVLRVADEPQPRVRPIRDVRQRAMQVRRVTGRDDRLAFRELQVRNMTPRGIVDLGHHLRPGVAGADLRLIGQLLERIVVPELHLDAAIHRPPLRGLVRGDRV